MINIILGIFIFSLICYSLSNQLVYTKGPFDLYKGIRYIANALHPQIGYIFTCMICLPTWIGMLLSILDIWIFTNVSFTPMNMLITYSLNTFNIILIILFDGLIGSALTWLIHTWQESKEATTTEYSEEGDSPDIQEKIVLKNKMLLND